MPRLRRKGRVVSPSAGQQNCTAVVGGLGRSGGSHISDFEEHVAALARTRSCVDVMCGHIHTAADKMIGDVHYLNSGDWVESFTAIGEHWDGRYELVEYKRFLRDYPQDDDGAVAELAGERVEA